MPPRHRVLIVDDEPAVLAALRLAFEEHPALEVTVASSAADAIEKLRARGADLVVTDKNLPDRSGVELVRALRQERPSLPAVLITGYANADSRRDGEALGLTYVEKPFGDIFDLPRLVLDILGKAS